MHTASPVKDTLPNRIKELRTKRKLTQKDIGDRFGVYTSTVHHWENGNVQVPDHAKLALAELFGVSVAYLMRWPEDAAA